MQTMAHRMRALFLVVVSSTFVLACPPEGKRDPVKSDPTVCSKVGQTCEFSPGKLGSCVQKDDCPSGQTCFNCQSQH